MVIRTKPYRIKVSTYMLCGFRNILRQQWWAFLGGACLLLLGIFLRSFWLVGISLTLALLYTLFWSAQFYAVPYTQEGQTLFERIYYEISSQRIVLCLSAKMGMPIAWGQIQRVIGGQDDLLLVLGLGQFIYLPLHVFRNPNEFKVLKDMLKQKGLLR